MNNRRFLAAWLVLLTGLALPATGLAIRIRASLTDIENDVMCVVCHESLAISQSPQADAERNYILMLIGRGESKAQIERQLVAQYGPSVLGKPPARGLSLSLYILPPALLALGAVILAVTLPRWRRRAAARAAASGSGMGSTLALDPADAQRLDDELSRYGG
jgi:cytochrome c-type biogenesis protein CcmH